ncbi:PREDICTED: progonadoliberin-2 [Dipodomys ordii]|uniref:Progonadoliberin-2 n=1 Tax=Dipodomys ordii TaxID=10020 RepID=A0A1S3EQ94_DIPOR|nr:PREDICTED: progonadoliberin-2 [Dipodomys ordii]
MASSKLYLLLLLLLLTGHPGPSRAQHWSHGWYPGGKRAPSSSQDPRSDLGSSGSLFQSAHSLPSDAMASSKDPMPWEARARAQWSHRKQHLVQTLLWSRITQRERSVPPPFNKKCELSSCLVRSLPRPPQLRTPRERGRQGRLEGRETAEAAPRRRCRGRGEE